jgi:hypothetical protein
MARRIPCPSFKVVITDEMREQLDAARQLSCRTMTREIEFRLRESLLADAAKRPQAPRDTAAK